MEPEAPVNGDEVPDGALGAGMSETLAAGSASVAPRSRIAIGMPTPTLTDTTTTATATTIVRVSRCLRVSRFPLDMA